MRPEGPGRVFGCGQGGRGQRNGVTGENGSHGGADGGERKEVEDRKWIE